VRSDLTEAEASFIRWERVARLATVDAEGQPHVVPVCPVLDGDHLVFMDLGSYDQVSVPVTVAGGADTPLRLAVGREAQHAAAFGIDDVDGGTADLADGEHLSGLAR